jgi:hypothetical protein
MLLFLTEIMLPAVLFIALPADFVAAPPADVMLPAALIIALPAVFFTTEFLADTINW